jgi:FixJ family two-component response regulator
MQLNVATDHLTHVHVTPATDATVFVIDDDILVRDSLKELIRADGWRPETLASAEELLAFPPHLSPCCMVLESCFPR